MNCQHNIHSLMLNLINSIDAQDNFMIMKVKITLEKSKRYKNSLFCN